MKCLITVILIAVIDCFAGVVNRNEFAAGDRFFYFPGDGDDTLHLVDTQEPVDEIFIDIYSRNSAYSVYWLFTRENPIEGQLLIANDTASVTESNLNLERNVVFLVHGWFGHGGNNLNQMLTSAFLEDNDVNVIVVDWSQLAWKNYLTAKAGVSAVGSALGQFINWLTDFGLCYDRVHLVGFSLGAHLVGNAGRETGSRIRRITALDPAGPLWGNDEDRLSRTDAHYVEVIHTNTALYGFSEPCGHADFFPNGGSIMPGCWLNMCSHSRSYEYMAATVRYDHLQANECSSLRGASVRCLGEVFPMGNSDLSKTGSGIYRVNTQSDYPY